MKSKAGLLTRDYVDDITKLWSLFVECLKEVQVQCIFIVIDGIDYLENSAVDDNGIDEGSAITEQLNNLVNDSTILIKVLFTAALARESETPASADGMMVLTTYQLASPMQPQRKLPLDIMQNSLALVPHKLVKIQGGRYKSITFADLPMLYPSNSTIYTTEDSQLRAYVVADLAGMDLKAIGRYSQLQIRAWSIDYNGKYFTKRYYTLFRGRERCQV